MADHAAAEAAPETPPPKGPGLKSLLVAIAVVSVIVIVEVCAASMLLPSADDTRAVGRQLVAGHGADDHGGDAGHGAEADHGDGGHGSGHGEQTREVNLGVYHIVSFNPKTGKSLSIDFELFGAVLADEQQEFDHLYGAHEKRVSEQITIAIRGLQAEDLTDPGLGLIKRIILEKTNRALGKPLVREAIVSQFSFIER